MRRRINCNEKVRTSSSSSRPEGEVGKEPLTPSLLRRTRPRPPNTDVSSPMKLN